MFSRATHDHMDVGVRVKQELEPRKLKPSEAQQFRFWTRLLRRKTPRNDINCKKILLKFILERWPSG